MPIAKEASIAVDSTMSLSSPDSTPQVRRAARTYGRPRISELESLSSSYSDDTSADSPIDVYKTAPKGLDEEVPPSSDGLHALSETEHVGSDGDDTDNENAGGSTDFKFEWQKRVSKVLEESDEEHEFPDVQFGNDDNSQQTLCNASTSPTSSGKVQVPPAAMSSIQGNSTSLSPRVVKSLQRSPTHSLDSFPPTLSKVGGRRRAIIDSDTELDSPTKPSSHPATSPLHLHPITTPQSRSSSTPPTSDDEMTRPKLVMKPFHTTKRSAAHSSATLSSHHTDDEDHLPRKGSNKGTRAGSASQRPSRKGKVKAPTKKELSDTTRARARLAAEQHVSIARTNISEKFTIPQLFARQAAPASGLPSDPISEYSPHPVASSAKASAPLDNIVPLGGTPESAKPEGDDEDFPDASTLLKSRIKDAVPPLVTEATRNLREQKEKYLAVRKLQDYHHSDGIEDDDDLLIVDNVTAAQDMHVVAQEAADERRTQKQRHTGPSKGKRIIERFGHVRGKNKGPANLTQAELNKQMAERVAAVNRSVIEQKEAEWTKRGGTIKSNSDANTSGANSFADTVKLIAEKALQATDRVDADMDDDASDEEWAPDKRERGSDASDEEEEEEVASEIALGEDDITMVNEELPDDENAAPMVRRSRAVILNSDSEDDENYNPDALSIVGRLSVDEATEDEDDKENSTRLMYDKSDDKENKAVVRHSFESRPPLGFRKESSQSLDDARLDLPSFPTMINNNVGDRAEKPREPLKELLSDEDPFTSPESTPAMSFTARLLQASPNASSAGPFISQQFSPQKLGGLAFSQFSDGNGATTFQAASLEPGFSQLFDSQTQTATSGGMAKPRSPSLNELPLTLDVTLRPALEVDESILREADAVFEKEQEYVLEAAQAKPSAHPQLYINDHGFLTQTRPDVSSPDVYRMFSPSQRKSLTRTLTEPQSVSRTPALGSRHPLQTISFAASDDLDIETPAVGRLRRIRRRRSSSPSPRKDGGYDSSPSQSPIKPQPLLNAFDVMARNAMRIGKDPRKQDKHTEDAAKEFVAAEAEESDDDMGNWTVRKSKDDEEEGADADTTLVELLDDKAMDEDTEAVDKVLEKFQEHQQEDDEKLQKLHQNAVDGKFRHRKRNGIDLDGSDDESDDDEAAAIRRKMYKRARHDRDDMRRLGEVDETRPFFLTYQGSLVDDPILIPASNGDGLTVDPMGNDDDGGDDSEDSDAPPNVVTARDLNKEIRERLANGDIETTDVNDVSWIDADDEEAGEANGIQVKRASIRPGPVHASSSFSKRGLMDIDFDFDVGPSSQRSATGGPTDSHKRMQQWAQSERRSGRLETTGRSVSRVAVTGHKGGGGEIRMKGSKQSNASVKIGKIGGAPAANEKGKKKEVKASRSLLGGVDRRGRFE